jgi:hypothetical protein
MLILTTILLLILPEGQQLLLNILDLLIEHEFDILKTCIHNILTPRNELLHLHLKLLCLFG